MTKIKSLTDVHNRKTNLLIVGSPGTGKTLAATQVQNSAGAPIIVIDDQAAAYGEIFDDLIILALSGDMPVVITLMDFTQVKESTLDAIIESAPDLLVFKISDYCNTNIASSLFGRLLQPKDFANLECRTGFFLHDSDISVVEV